jgi:hypothetical protein
MEIILAEKTHVAYFCFWNKRYCYLPLDRRSMNKAVDVLITGIKSSSLEKNNLRIMLQTLRKCVKKIDQDLNCFLILGVKH